MIKVADLSYTYPKSDQPALRGLNFELKPGEVFGFLGPSGAGKSTTQKILIGLLAGFQGRATVMDRPVERWGADYYEHIGVAFEQPNHFLKLSALENLRYFAALYTRRTRDPLDLLGCVGLAEEANLRVEQYSKGMKTRLTVARALLNDPDLLFLDEPTSGLDPVNAQKVKDLIREQQRAGKTVFLTTHNMAMADELCDRVAFLVDGAIRLLDSPRALKQQYGKPLVRVEYRDGAGPAAVEEQKENVVHPQSGGLQRRDFDLRSLGENQAFLALIRDASVETIHTQEASLEEIFIQVTGRRLE